MRIAKRLAMIPALAMLAACGTEEPKPSADLSFLDDLELAVPAVETQATLSPVELGLQGGEEAAEAERPAAPAQRSTPRPAAPRASSSQGTAASTAPAPAPAPRVETVKHTKRDAAIGAGAGAAIGAVVAGPGERVQGAAIGAVLGGVLGGVIGNNVDKSTRVVYDQ